jgi:cardiolipin synthase A/B
MPWVLSLIFVAVEVLGFASALHAVFAVRTAQGTIAWAIALTAVSFFSRQKLLAFLRESWLKISRNGDQCFSCHGT